MSRLPDTGPSLRRYLERAKRQSIRESNASAYNRSGISVTAEDEVTVDGALIVTGPMAVGGTLSLPFGIVDNDALASPIDIAADAGNADAFTVTTTATDFVTFTIPIPAGYTRALVKAEGMIFIYNTSAVGDYLYSRLYVDSPSTSSWSREMIGDLNPTSGISLTVIKQIVFTGLAGGVITVRQQAKTAFASMPHASNAMTATASVWFLR